MTINKNPTPGAAGHVADHHEIAEVLQNQDTLANRPAPGVAGRWFKATDTGQIFREDGAAWQEMALPASITAGLAAFLASANAWAGKQTFSSDGYFASGRPWTDAMAAPYNAKGDNATDDTSAINSTIAAVDAAGGGVVFLPRGTYVCLGGLNLYGRSTIVLRGSAPTPLYNRPGTMLKYSGVATSRFIDVRSSAYCGFENIGFYNVTSANTGWMIDFSQDFGGLVDRNVFGGFVRHCSFNGNTAANTNCILLDGTYEWAVERCVFINYNIGVCGRAPGSNGVGAGGIGSVYGNSFNPAVSSPIWSPSVAWTVINNAFEPDTAGKANAIRHNTDPGPSYGCQGLVFEGNWCGDVTVAGGTWIDADGAGYHISGNLFGGDATGTGASALKVDQTSGIGSLVFVGNQLNNVMGVDVGSDPTKIRGDIEVRGNNLLSAPARQMGGALATNTGDAIGMPTNGTGPASRAIVTIDPLLIPGDSSGDWVKTAQAGLWRSNFYLSNQGHQAAYLLWYVELSRGLWRLEVLRVADVDGCILTWTLDGTNIFGSGGFDSYNAGGQVLNQDSDGGASFNVAISGLHQLRLTTATKNAGNVTPNYFARIHGIQLRRNLT